MIISPLLTSKGCQAHKNYYILPQKDHIAVAIYTSKTSVLPTRPITQKYWSTFTLWFGHNFLSYLFKLSRAFGVSLFVVHLRMYCSKTHLEFGQRLRSVSADVGDFITTSLGSGLLQLQGSRGRTDSDQWSLPLPQPRCFLTAMSFSVSRQKQKYKNGVLYMCLCMVLS